MLEESRKIKLRSGGRIEREKDLNEGIMYVYFLKRRDGGVKCGVRSQKFIWAPCEQLYSLDKTP
jgi:hypothetical protein